jgi:hypothetical protein
MSRSVHNVHREEGQNPAIYVGVDITVIFRLEGGNVKIGDGSDRL